MSRESMEGVYDRRTSSSWRSRLYRALQPPAPLIHNPREPKSFPLGRHNLYIGGGGAVVPGYINIDLFPLRGVDVVTDAERLPFPAGIFQVVECDAVLEHVQHPDIVLREISRVTMAGGHVHLVTPFCHPFHAYPSDYRRFTLEGLCLLAGEDFEVVAQGWRTGPTATLLVFVMEYFKMWLPWRPWRVGTHFALGWLLFPLRYLDWVFLRLPEAGRLGNHCYVWLKKR